MTPGCTSTVAPSEETCSHISVTDLIVLFQYTDSPHLLPLIGPRDPGFAADFFFDSPDSFADTQTGNFIRPVFAQNFTKSFSFEENGFLSIVTDMDISRGLHNLTVKGLQLNKKLSVSMEVNLGQWFLNDSQKLGDEGKASEPLKGVSLLSLSPSGGQTFIEIFLEKGEGDGNSNSLFRLRPNFNASKTISPIFEIPDSFVDQMRSQASTGEQPVSETPLELAQNLKVTLFLEDTGTRSTHAHLLILKPENTPSSNSLKTFSWTLGSEISLPSQVDLTLLKAPASGEGAGPSAIGKLQIPRVAISDSISNLLPKLVVSGESSKFRECHSRCLVPMFRAKGESSCWQCTDDLVYDSSRSTCQNFCFYSKKNVNGNCTKCRFSDCSDAGENVSLQLKKEGESMVVLAPGGIYGYSDDYFSKHFDLFLIRDELPQVPVDFTVRKLDSSPNAFEVVPQNNKQISSVLARKHSGWALSVKPDSNIISNSRTLYHQRAAIYSEPQPGPLDSAMNPIDNSSNRMMLDPSRVFLADLSPGLSGFNEGLSVDAVYKECKYNDRTMHNLALALFILMCIMNVLFVLYSLLLWNRTLVFKVPAITGVVCLHMNCLYQAMIFCLFYEKDLPPALTSFLRHSYYYAVHWHGAFRSVALDNHGDDRLFFDDYQNRLSPRRLGVDMVQNVFINFGVILLIWGFVWLIAALLWLRLRKPGVMYRDHFSQYFQWKFRSLVDRIASSFVFKLAFWVWAIFSVEFAFLLVFDMATPIMNHPFFNASFAFSIIFLVLHFSAVLCLLYLRFYLSEFFYGYRRASTTKGTPPGNPPVSDPDNKTSIEKGIRTLSKEAKETIKKLNPAPLVPHLQAKAAGPTDVFSIHFNHPAFRSSKCHSKYHLLFALQGLKKRFLGLHNWGLTTLVFSFYGIIISSTIRHPRVAITINLILVFLMLVYLVLSKPGFSFLPRAFLLAAYFIFFVAKLILVFYIYGVVQKNPGRALCDLDLAILSLFFVALCLMMVGLLLSIWFFLKFEKMFQGYFADTPLLPVEDTAPGFLPPDEDRSIIEVTQDVQVERPSGMIRRLKKGRRWFNYRCPGTRERQDGRDLEGCRANHEQPEAHRVRHEAQEGPAALPQVRLRPASG